MKRNPVVIVIAAVLIVVFGLLLFVYQVRKSEVAIVTRFGKPDRVQAEPGPGMRWPWPIENVYKLDQRIQNFECKFEETKLPDQNILLLLTYVGWKISDPKEFFPKFAGGSVEEAEKALEGLVRSAKNEVAGQHPLADFISADEKQMKFKQIEKEIQDRVEQEVAAHHYGLEIKFVQIKKIGLPENNTQTVFDRMTSERQKYISKIQSEGEEEASKIKSGANRTASDLLADADAQAMQIKGQGESEAIKSLAILQQNPDLANFNMKITALEQLLKDRATLILDQSTPPLDLLQGGKALRNEPTHAPK